jgi:hypothetical protein
VVKEIILEAQVFLAVVLMGSSSPAGYTVRRKTKREVRICGLNDYYI